MAAMICPECKEARLFGKTGEYETTYLDRNDESRSLKVPGVTWLACANCGETILDDRAMTVIESARRAAMGLLTPEEISRAEDKFAENTESYVRIFGNRRENLAVAGSPALGIQSEGFDRYLRLLILDRTNADILEQVASEKAGVPFGESLAELEETFVYLKDVRTVEERSRSLLSINLFKVRCKQPSQWSGQMFVVTFVFVQAGGVGRTLALVNCAFRLAQEGRKVFILDFDLEAPGVDAFRACGNGESRQGIVEYV